MRRYEILLPLRFNDDSAVPDELVGNVLLALRDDLAPSHSRHRQFAVFGNMKGVFIAMT